MGLVTTGIFAQLAGIPPSQWRSVMQAAEQRCGNTPGGYEVYDIKTCAMRPESGDFFSKVGDIVSNPVTAIQAVTMPLLEIPGVLPSTVHQLAVAGGSTTSQAYDVAQAATLAVAMGKPSAEGANMGLDLGGILGSVGKIVSGINTSGYGNVSGILGGGLQIAGAALTQPSAQPMYGPSSPYAVQTLAPSSQVIRSAAPAVVGGVGMALVSKEAVQVLLGKIAAALGRKGITLARAVEIARKLGKFFTSPEAIATYLGIGVGELALLITAHSAKKRRRMNPANSKALARAARRIKSFHRLCSHTDLIKTRRRSYGGARCTSCRKSPCRC